MNRTLPKEKNEFIRKRDLAMLFVSCIGILLSFQQQNRYTIEDIWIKPIDPLSAYSNGHFPRQGEEL
jgi:hypothetical protein